MYITTIVMKFFREDEGATKTHALGRRYSWASLFLGVAILGRRYSWDFHLIIYRYYFHIFAH